MTVVVNGEQRHAAPGTTVADLVRGLEVELHQAGVAIAVNGEVVSRGRWEGHVLSDGDHVEVLAAAPGG